MSALRMTYGLTVLNSSATLGSTLGRLAGHVTECVGPLKLVKVDVEGAQYAVSHGMGLVL